LGAEALAEARKHCAALARANSRDQWLGALYAPPEARDALIALAAYEHEIRQARFRARDRGLAALRLAWWRGVVRGERDGEAAGHPAALALLRAVDSFALPRDELESMLDARVEELFPREPFDLEAFEAYAGDDEGARLKLAARVCAGGGDLAVGAAHAPASLALSLTRMLAELPSKAGSAPTLFPVDIAARHGATPRDFDYRCASAEVLSACAEVRALARAKLIEAENRLETSAKAILPAFVPLGALGLDLDRLGRNAAKPFDPLPEASRLRRQWAIWRWARRV
jgi:phytoene synthase